MQVLCVKPHTSAEYLDGSPAPVGPVIEVGSTYSVSRTIEFEDGLYYFLVGFPYDVCYWSSLFAALPDEPAEVIEETEPAYATA